MNKLLIIVIIIAFSCRSKRSANLEITIERTFETALISSGSGLAAINDTVFIIGDDAEYIAGFSVNDSLFHRISLYPQASRARIDRAIKHDLESGILWRTSSQNFLIAFGSGGISPGRDTLFAINVNDTAQNFKRSLTPMYQAIKNECGLKDNELNIEGAALISKTLLLFNRWKNFVISINWNDFTRFIIQGGNTPSFVVSTIALPIVNGYQVGFSGACTLNENEVLFTASLEETTDFTKDGAVKASYIGMLKVGDDSTITLGALNIFKDSLGNIINDKLESIEIVGKEKQDIKAIAVADNDNGTSKLYQLNIKTH